MEDKELWSWGKFFKGIFVGTNYAKALVLGLCLCIMLTIGYCVVAVVKSKLVKPLPQPTQTIGTNSGKVTTVNKQEDKKGWQLFGGVVQINN
jgi:hypothetical protein